MPEPNEKLALSLEALKRLQDQNITAIRTDSLSRIHRERLLKNGFLQEVLQGWYIAVPAGERVGDTTHWYTNFWNFCGEYLEARYGEDYYLFPDQSLLLHTGNYTVPKQLIIRTSAKSNFLTELLAGTSILHMEAVLPASAKFVRVNSIRMMDLASSLVHCTPSVFEKTATDVRTALSMIGDASELLDPLLAGGHTVIAGRLAGAMRNIGRDRIADDIISAMNAAEYKSRESDPFKYPSPVFFSNRERSPFVNRIKLFWSEMRDTIIAQFPKAPEAPKDIAAYMKQVEELYVADAYHSLSIERYRVTPELIEKVRSGTWDSSGNEEDKKQKDVMAARGYYLAREKVKESILSILKGRSPGEAIDEDHTTWYRELFAPSVTAGILKPQDLAGYRNQQVYIGGSKHVPVSNEAVRDTMPALFDLLKNEPEASVRAVLGHFIFVFIHPYMDGNGRMGRFLMNAMLASGGYPWTVIPVEERDTYMAALEKASVEQDISDFSKYLAYLVDAAMRGEPVAKVKR
ncbi:MAG: Fic family protein [Bacteroidia bacterium]